MPLGDSWVPNVLALSVRTTLFGDPIFSSAAAVLCWAWFGSGTKESSLFTGFPF